MKPKDVVNFCVADNILRLSPIECLSHVFGELIKTGNTFQFYSYLAKADKNKQPQDFYVVGSDPVTVELNKTKMLIRQLGLNLSDAIYERASLDFGVFYDSFNIGGPVPLYDFFRLCMNSGLIKPKEGNIQLLEDHQFWASGKKSHGLKISMNGSQFPLN